MSRIVTRGAMLLLAGAALAGCRPASDASDASDTADTMRAGETTVPQITPRPGAAGADVTGDSGRVLTSLGWGPLRIGMTRAQVVAAAGDDANPNAVGGADPEACDQFRPARAPRGLLVMIERDTLTRISLSAGAGIATEDGFAVGDSAAAVLRHYGARGVVSPHKYQSAPAKYITIWTRGRPPASSARGIVYEIGADDRVVHVHAGGPSIQYVEGCS